MRILIYCTKAKPYLSKDIVSSGKYVLSNTKNYFNRGDLNGVVWFKGVEEGRRYTLEELGL